MVDMQKIFRPRTRVLVDVILISNSLLFAFLAMQIVEDRLIFSLAAGWNVFLIGIFYLIVRPLLSDRIALCPPLVIDAGEIALLFERFTRGLDATWAWARGEGLV